MMLLDLTKLLLKPLSYKRVKLDQSVSIGMAAHGNAEVTKAALNYLFSSVQGDFELILVDDASPDDTLDVFLDQRGSHKNLKIFSFKENLEYCHSVNAILSHAKGHYVFFISNDIFVTPTYFRELIACLNDNPSFGIARGCSNFVDGHLQPHNLLNAEYKFEDMIEMFRFAEALSKVFDKRVPAVSPYLTGDAFAVSRRAIDRIGGFDTRYFGYFGDVDYGIRCRSSGLLDVVSTRAFAYHNAGANINYLDPQENAKKLQRRFQRVHAAYGEFLTKFSINNIALPNELGPLDSTEFLSALSIANKKAESDSRLLNVPLEDYSQYLVE